MKILKIISLIVLGFWIVSSFAATVKGEEKSTRIATFIIFLFTLIPFYFISVVI